MPYVSHNRLQPPVGHWGGHWQTIIPSTFRQVTDITYVRERIDTPDGDFLLLDWAYRSDAAGAMRAYAPETQHAPLRPAARITHPFLASRLAIVAHGLEGDSGRPYVKGMAKALNAAGWDVLAWNCRGCGGEPNNLRSSYHIGSSHDLRTVVNHVLTTCSYAQLALVGFSGGGNMSLKYAGEEGNRLPSAIRGIVTFSVPLDLDAVANHFMRPANKLYDQRFLRTLIAKLRHKATQHDIDLSHLPKIRTMRQYDEYYGGPLHGFRNADDYYRQAASQYFLRDITVPTLIVNALNDPFLPAPCYTPAHAEHLPNVWLEVPQQGGHCGFAERGGRYWSERRAVDFLTELV